MKFAQKHEKNHRIVLWVERRAARERETHKSQHVIHCERQEQKSRNKKKIKKTPTINVLHIFVDFISPVAQTYNLFRCERYEHETIFRMKLHTFNTAYTITSFAGAFVCIVRLFYFATQKKSAEWSERYMKIDGKYCLYFIYRENRTHRKKWTCNKKKQSAWHTRSIAHKPRHNTTTEQKMCWSTYGRL